jgi:6-phosphogluconolactonase
MEIIELNKNESNKAELEQKAVSIISEKINTTLETGSQFVLTLAGGSSVGGILELLSKEEISWDKVHIFLADERIVPLDSSESNFKNLNEVFFSKIVIPEENIHKLDISIGTDEALIKYQNEFKKSGGQPDLILLSSGEDGHVASLFPQHESIKNENENYIKVENSPKAPNYRISLSKNTIKKSESAIVLFFGPSKYNAYQDFNNPLLSEIECPAQIVKEISDSYVLVNVLK